MAKPVMTARRRWTLGQWLGDTEPDRLALVIDVASADRVSATSRVAASAREGCMKSITAILTAIVATCSLAAFNPAHAAKCVGSGHRSTFGSDGAAYFEVKAGQSCHYVFNLGGRSRVRRS